VVGILAGVDAALRHLPGVTIGGRIGIRAASADENQAILVDQHHADTGAVGQILSGL